MRVAYIRVSTEEQNTQRQVEALEKYEIEKYFEEKVSGKNKNRVELQSMLDFVREGDEIYILDFSRLARNTQDLLTIVDLLEAKGVKLVSLKENIDTHTPTGKLMLTMIAAISSFERENLLERQREGIAIAKREGKYKGRQPIKIQDFSTFYNEYITRRINKTELAKKLKVSRPTLNKIITEYEKNPEIRALKII